MATPPPGKIITYKIYKNEDGKFRRELIWEKPMPVIYSIAENYMSSYKYSDGTPFKCNRKSYDSYMSSGGNSQQYNEWYRRYICATGGGPLVVADFNGDKKPDIGLATGWSYSVFNGTNRVVLWADYNTQDYSSKATGSSLFDFEGDGISEVLYADEIKLHVYKGPGSGVIDPATNTMSAEHLEDDNALTPMTIKLCDESVA